MIDRLTTIMTSRNGITKTYLHLLKSTPPRCCFYPAGFSNIHSVSDTAMDNSNPSSSLFGLPNEILGLVYSNLCRRDLISCASVNQKSFHISIPILWSRIQLSSVAVLKKSQSESIIRSICRLQSSLRAARDSTIYTRSVRELIIDASISYSGLVEIVIPFLHHAVEEFINLVVLHFDPIPYTLSSGIQEVDLARQVTALIPKVLKLPLLSRLKLRFIDPFAFETTYQCPSKAEIKQLSLKDLFLDYDRLGEVLDKFQLYCNSSLERLCLDSTMIETGSMTYEMWTKVLKFEKLRKLTLCGFHFHRFEIPNVLSKGFERSENLFWSFTNTRDWSPDFAFSESIISLSLQYLRHCNDSTLQFLLCTLPSVKNISVNQITENLYPSIQLLIPRLESFSYSDSGLINFNEILADMTKPASVVNCIKFSGLWELSSTVFEQVAQIPMLRKLVLNGCVVSESALSRCLGYCRHLEVVKLMDMWVSESSIIACLESNNGLGYVEVRNPLCSVNRLLIEYAAKRIASCLNADASSSGGCTVSKRSHRERHLIFPKVVISFTVPRNSRYSEIKTTLKSVPDVARFVKVWCDDNEEEEMALQECFSLNHLR
ncbi:hypothetical protein BKA69DRAFT_1178019 [Paraphysoderma sedebokerense]|nr:hypothetical protein BKA69DRAFT_1178019 [Paraphysoderma sedebokerense]